MNFTFNFISYASIVSTLLRAIGEQIKITLVFRMARKFNNFAQFAYATCARFSRNFQIKLLLVVVDVRHTIRGDKTLKWNVIVFNRQVTEYLVDIIIYSHFLAF